MVNPKARWISSNPPAGSSRCGMASRQTVMMAAGLGVLLLGGLLIYTNRTDTARLDAGANQIESLLRNARKYAAVRAGRVCLVLAEKPGATTTLLEVDPINEPDVMSPHIPHHPYNFLVDEDLVRIDSCRRFGSNLGDSTAAGRTPLSRSGKPIEAITFAPDGSFDSAVIELVSTDEGDTRTVLVELNGAIMQVSRRVMTPEQMEEYRAANKKRR